MRKNSKSSSTYKELLKTVKQRKIAPNQRIELQASIANYVLTNAYSIKSPNFREISSADLGLLFQITDEHFFDGLVGQYCEQKADRPLKFRLSTRMTSAGGMTTMQTSYDRRKPSTEFEIAIATTPLFATFKDEPTAVVSGLKCNNRLEALQRIMEHEMTHLVEMLLWDDSNCSAAPFKRIVRRFFGHTESNHQLLTPTDVARKRLGIAQGDKVTFSIEGRQLTGHVNRITKRATVLVANPNGTMYCDGRKYQKYYVPINRLKRA